MFSAFTRSYRPFVERADSAFELLSSVQHYIHVEVRKLYPDAEFPHFFIEQPAENHLRMYYTSERRLPISPTASLRVVWPDFGETATITKTILTEDGSQVLFDIIE